MKQNVYTFPLAVFLLLCTACTQAEINLPVAGGNEGDGDGDKGVPLAVKNLGFSVEVESRSIVTGGPTSTAAGNTNPLTAIGVCVTKTSSSGTVSSYNTSVRSQQFVWNAGVNPAVWQLADGEETLLLYSEKGTVYAYSPAEKSVSITGSPKVPVMGSVKVIDKQRFVFTDGGVAVDPSTDVQWETDQDDYLYATATKQVDRWHPEVSFTMSHALAKVCFRVVEPDGGTAFSESRVKQVVLKSTGGFRKSTSAKLDIATGELSGTLTAVDLLTFQADGDMRAIGTVDDTKGVSTVPIQAFGLVVPVTGVSVTLELTLDDDRTFLMSPPADSDSPGTFTATWEKGKNYIYNIRMSPQGIEIADVTVAGWEEGGSTNVPVE